MGEYDYWSDQLIDSNLIKSGHRILWPLTITDPLDIESVLLLEVLLRSLTDGKMGTSDVYQRFFADLRHDAQDHSLSCPDLSVARKEYNARRLLSKIGAYGPVLRSIAETAPTEPLRGDLARTPDEDLSSKAHEEDPSSKAHEEDLSSKALDGALAEAFQGEAQLRKTKPARLGPQRKTKSDCIQGKAPSGVISRFEAWAAHGREDRKRFSSSCPRTGKESRQLSDYHRFLVIEADCNLRQLEMRGLTEAGQAEYHQAMDTYMAHRLGVCSACVVIGRLLIEHDSGDCFGAKSEWWHELVELSYMLKEEFC